MTRQIEQIIEIVQSAENIQEQQRELWENFTLLKDLVVTPAYIHFDRHKDTSETITTTPTIITNYDASSDIAQRISVDLTTGLVTFPLNGRYQFDIFIYIDGTGTYSYTLSILDTDGVTVLDSETFDVHGAAGQARAFHTFLLEFPQDKNGISLAIASPSGPITTTIEQVHCTINRVDNYNIPA